MEQYQQYWHEEANGIAVTSTNVPKIKLYTIIHFTCHPVLTKCTLVRITRKNRGLANAITFNM